MILELLIIKFKAFRLKILSNIKYELSIGPKTWLDVYQNCGGELQSPINLGVDNAAVYARSMHDLGRIKFSDGYKGTTEGKLHNNGHTVEFKPKCITCMNITDGPFGNDVYSFNQLHFHWGSDNDHGTEHEIIGKQYPMEMHMVHINAKYMRQRNLNHDYLANKDGIAVLGFLFNVTETNDYEPLEAIISKLESISDPESVENPTVKLKLDKFISSVNHGGYYSYNGSLTTPSCNQVVNWLVFEETINISERQIEVFRTKLKDQFGTLLVDNYRPVQNLNNRDVSHTD